MDASSLNILGMHEEINLPQVGIFKLKSKTDTGAYNSAIDCCYSEERERLMESTFWFLYYSIKPTQNTRGKNIQPLCLKLKKCVVQMVL